MQAPFELLPDTNQPCVQSEGHYWARTWIQNSRHHMRFPLVDLGRQVPLIEDPSNIMNPEFAATSIFKQLNRLERQKLIAAVLYRVCQKKRHEYVPKTNRQSLSLETVHSFAFLGRTPYFTDVYPTSHGEIRQDGTGTVHMNIPGVRQRHTTALHAVRPLVYVPESAKPLTGAVEAMSSREGGSIYVLLGGYAFEHIYTRQEMAQKLQVAEAANNS